MGAGRPTTIPTTVAVLGLGPSGRAAAHRLSALGVATVAVDPTPDRVWRPTYATWEDELPSWLPAGVVATRSRPRVFARRERTLDRTYAVLDTPGLQRALHLDGVRVLPGRVDTVGPHRVELADGTVVVADLVVDARGSRPTPSKAQQTAYGLVVDRTQAAPIGGTWFMDWRADHDAGPDASPSFLYAVPLGEDRILLEETCLVGRPPLGGRELRRRLLARLAGHGVRLTGAEPVEHVRFATEPEPQGQSELESELESELVSEPGSRSGRWSGPGTGRGGSHAPLPFGARAGVMHPATGYSVAPSLSAADRLADFVATSSSVVGLEHRLWDSRTRRVWALRRVGLTTLLRLQPRQVPDFFEAFFALPLRLQTAYLSRADRPAAVLAAMSLMAARLPPALSAVAISSGLQALRRDG